MMSTIGTEYQTVIPWFWINEESCMGKADNPSGTSEIAAPALIAAKMSKTDRSKFHGAWLDRRSATEMEKVSHAQLTKVSAFRWESMTPLGWPVDPEVKRM